MSSSKKNKSPSAANATSNALTVYGEMIRHCFTGLAVHHALYTACELRIPDLLASGATKPEALARRAGADPDGLARLMRVLARAGIFKETEDGGFSLTPTSAALRSDVPGSMRGWVMFAGSGFYTRAWARLSDSVRTGRPAFEAANGASFFDYLGAHSDAQTIFDEAMTSISGPEAEAVTSAYDFSRFGKIIDVGGGHGHLIATILSKWSNVRGAVFDQPQVVAEARSQLKRRGLEQRCELVAGSFFDSIPGGYDAYVLKYIVHDWSDEKAAVILRNCRSAMKSEARLLLVETVNSPRAASDAAILSDLEMLVILGGKERSEEGFSALLAEAGFRLGRIIPTACPLSVIEGVPE